VSRRWGAPSSLVVIVSSQSYDRDEITMQVEVDGHLVVDYVSFPLESA
jgi:hypothetical protein